MLDHVRYAEERRGSRRVRGARLGRRRRRRARGRSSRSSSSSAGCRSWRCFTERFWELGRLICFDHRGTGLSDHLRGYRLPTIEERVDDLRAVLDAAGSERVVLVALADGGPLGCMFAGTHPERTMRLLLCNTRPRIAWSPDYPWGMRETQFEREMADIDRDWGMRAMAEAMPAAPRSKACRSRSRWTGTWGTCGFRPAPETPWLRSGCSTSPTSATSSARSACRRSS